MTPPLPDLDTTCPECGTAWNATTYNPYLSVEAHEGPAEHGDWITCGGCLGIFEVVPDGLKRVGTYGEEYP